ncbi:zinc finger protein [Cystoisospora suis]|uniref:Zinc finger protein n=1 Tax=Cystoisospora suis TaxID=483139 RepID=A0A2C6LC74_9APIC|nr:zinc finger protein [Cystoisospora suis]
MVNNLGGDFRVSHKDLGAVLRDSDEWSFLEYLLQMSARTSRVRLLQAWHIAPPHIISNFERRTKGRLLAYSFVDMASLDEENSLQDIARRGFKVSPRGMRFAVGNFSLPGFPLMRGGPNELDDPYTLHPAASLAQKEQSQRDRAKFLEAARTQLLTGERRIFEFLLCQVGVGRSVVVEDQKEASGTRFSLLWEYDSAYLEKGAPAPQESLTVHYENVEEVTSAGDAFLARDGEDEGRREEQGHPLSTASLFLQAENKKVAAGVLPQHTFRHDYVVYCQSSSFCLRWTRLLKNFLLSLFAIIAKTILHVSGVLLILPDSVLRAMNLYTSRISLCRAIFVYH